MENFPGIHGQTLQITVVQCHKLIDKQWFGRQDPYVIVEYASTKFRTSTDTDGGTNPSFGETFTIILIEGLRQIDVSVWNSNSMSSHDFIGSGKIQLNKVLTQGYDDTVWPLLSKSGRFAGDVQIIMQYPNAQAKFVPPVQNPYPYQQPPNIYPPPGPYGGIYPPPPPRY